MPSANATRIVNGKVMFDGATARYEVPPIEARDLINELLAALREFVACEDMPLPSTYERARAAIARAQGAS